MSIEKYLESGKNEPPTFKKVMGRLLTEKENEDSRPFKWEEEIGDEEWSGMEEAIKENLLDDPRAIFIAGLLSSMRVLDPNRPLHIDESTWKILEEQVIEYKTQRNWDEYGHFASHIHIIDPSRSIDIDDTLWKRIESRLEWSRTHYDFIIYVTLFLNIHLLDPSRTMSRKKEIKEELMLEIMTLNTSNNKAEDHLANLISTMRLLDPQYKPTLAEGVWANMEKLLHAQKRRKHYWQFTDLAARMRIIAAHKVEVTKDGIIITDTPPAQLDNTPPPRPMRKKL